MGKCGKDCNALHVSDMRKKAINIFLLWAAQWDVSCCGSGRTQKNVKLIIMCVLLARKMKREVWRKDIPLPCLCYRSSFEVCLSMCWRVCEGGNSWVTRDLTFVEHLYVGFWDLTQSLGDRWMRHTHIHTHNQCFRLKVVDWKNSLVIMGLFSSLFIWRLKCSLGAPFSTLVWLKRFSWNAYAYMWAYKCTRHTCKHTPQLLFNIFFTSTQCSLGSGVALQSSSTL